MGNENNLKLLAHCYNEKYYFLVSKECKIHDVTIIPIKAEMYFKDDKNECSYNIEVRVTSLIHDNFGKNLREIKWEGKLQD
jgi:hypothetical protein